MSLTYSLSRRRLLGLAAAAASVPVLGACQNSSESGQPGAAGTGPSPAGGFPVTIEHAQGSTTIESAPSRIVTVGYTDQEMFLALGTKPVGVRPWFGEDLDHTWPWVAPAWGGETPTYIGSDLDFEKIAGLQPDVIVGLYAEITDAEYAKLSQIAPTVAEDPASVAYTTDRAVMFRTAAKIVGRSEEAEQQLRALDEKFATVRAEHPQFADRTAAVLDPSNKTFWAFASGDPRGRFLADLGYRASADLDKAIGDKFGAEISSETPELIDLDNLVLLADAATSTWLKQNKVYQQLAVVKERRALEVPYYEAPHAGAAMAYNTVLSVPYAVTDLVPRLAALPG